MGNLFFKVEKLRARNARNSRDMARDLSAASKKLYGALADMQKKNTANSKKLTRSTTAASVASANNLRRAKAQFASKMSTLTNLIAANYKKNTRSMAKITGVVKSINKANKADRANSPCRARLFPGPGRRQGSQDRVRQASQDRR